MLVALVNFVVIGIRAVDAAVEGWLVVVVTALAVLERLVANVVVGIDVLVGTVDVCRVVVGVVDTIFDVVERVVLEVAGMGVLVVVTKAMVAEAVEETFVVVTDVGTLVVVNIVVERWLVVVTPLVETFAVVGKLVVPEVVVAGTMVVKADVAGGPAVAEVVSLVVEPLVVVGEVAITLVGIAVVVGSGRPVASEADVEVFIVVIMRVKAVDGKVVAGAVTEGWLVLAAIVELLAVVGGVAGVVGTSVVIAVVED